MALERRSYLTRRTPPARTDVKPRIAPKRRGTVGFTAATKAEADARYGHRCAIGGPGCTAEIATHHHRRMRSQGGLGGLENCLPLCRRCHTLVHHGSAIAWAYRHGALVRSYRSPETTPVFLACDTDCKIDHVQQ